jgi:cyanophycin synthetase
MTPGRLNVVRIHGIRVLVDYAHNAAAVAGLMELVTAMPAQRRIGVLASPGDRRDADIHELGRLCAELDYAIVKEDADTRGRTRGDVAQLIRAGLIEGGMEPHHIEVVIPELAAVDRAIAVATDQDVIVVLADKVRDVLTHVERLAAGPPVGVHRAG